MTETFRAGEDDPTRAVPPYMPPSQAPGESSGTFVFSPVPSQSAIPRPAAPPSVLPAAPTPLVPSPAGSVAPPPPARVPPAPATPATRPVVDPFARPQPTAGSHLTMGGGTVFHPVEPTPPPAPAPAPTRTRSASAGTRTRAGVGQERREDDLDIDAVLTRMVEEGASDAHLTTGAPPMIRIGGALRPLEDFPVLSPEPLRRVLYSIITQSQREKYEADLELDLAYAVRGLARFRVNMYQQRESIGAAFRVIPYEIKPLEALGVPPIVGSFAGLPRGLVLVTGPTGSGKSTTLASIIDLANRTREDHIMTVEDPIEFLHRHKKSIINQREVGQDTHSFANALKHVLRQDPDIILVGEMRDLETISVALTAAETGHLVFATLHTQDAAQTIDRVIDVFPAEQQGQVRTQLASALQGVVSQTLCKRAHGSGRVVATEVLTATPAIRNLIREGKTHQIYSAMQAGAKQGMHTMDQHLAELVRTGKITYEVGLEKCHNMEDYNRLTGRSTSINQGAAKVDHGMEGTR